VGMNFIYTLGRTLSKLWRGGSSSLVDTPCNMKLGTLFAALPPESQGY
jgi:hypothetical protein